MDFPLLYTYLTISWFKTLQLINSATRCSTEGLNLVQLTDLHFSCVLHNFNNSVVGIKWCTVKGSDMCLYL